MSRNLSRNQENVLRELSQHKDRVQVSELSINGMKGIVIGKIMSNLQHFGLVSGTKQPKEYSYKWQITGAGREWIADRDVIKIQDYQEEESVIDIVTPIDVVTPINAVIPQHTVSIPKSNIPPTTPDHFVFVVTQKDMADMMSARFGLEADEILLLKARVRTLEATIVENKKQMDILRRERDASMRERDTALELAEFLERKMEAINNALKGKL